MDDLMRFFEEVLKFFKMPMTVYGFTFSFWDIALWGCVAYVPYKIGKLQIQGFSEPTTPNKIKQSYHITQKAARSRPRAAFLRGKLGRRQDFSKK